MTLFVAVMGAVVGVFAGLAFDAGQIATFGFAVIGAIAGGTIGSITNEASR